MTASRATTRAVDIDCPVPGKTETVPFMGSSFERQIGCGAKAGHYCNGSGVGVDLCRERIAAARKVTVAKRSRRR